MGRNHFWTGFWQRGHEQFSESNSPLYRGVASAARTLLSIKRGGGSARPPASAPARTMADSAKFVCDVLDRASPNAEGLGQSQAAFAPCVWSRSGGTGRVRQMRQAVHIDRRKARGCGTFCSRVSAAAISNALPTGVDGLPSRDQIVRLAVHHAVPAILCPGSWCKFLRCLTRHAAGALPPSVAINLSESVLTVPPS
jgi:hypothetical protein